MTAVSVIVPVYNAEGYLSRCLDSIISNNFCSMENICVNDGSADNSESVLRAYSNFDKRIKIINKDNGGLSSARNTGIKEAKGEYILFVNSDDYISSNAIDTLYKNAQRNKSDLVMFDFVNKSIKSNKLQITTIPGFQKEVH